MVIQDPSSHKELSQNLEEFFHFNDPNATNPFTNWNAHKASIRGALIKLSSKLNRSCSAKITTLLTELRALETQNQSNPSVCLASKLSMVRNSLRELFCIQNENYMRKLKLNFYANNNKAGKFFADRLKIQRSKTRIPHIFHPKTSAKVENPQAIADAFAEYYSSLYNLKDDTSTVQPVSGAIEQFLAKLTLPSLSDLHLQSLNAAISSTELDHAISSLPAYKAPGPDGLSNAY